MRKINIFTDGSSLGNPGPAGAAAILLTDGYPRKIIARPLGKRTNNQAELVAVLISLRTLKNPAKAMVHLFTDSQLIKGFLVDNWKPKTNIDLVKAIRDLTKTLGGLEVIKVKGHSGDELNELADSLARKEAAAQLRLNGGE